MPRTLGRRCAEAFEERACIFIDPVEGVAGEGVALQMGRSATGPPARRRRSRRRGRRQAASRRHGTSRARKTPILTRFWARRPRLIRTWRRCGAPIRSYGRGCRKAAGRRLSRSMFGDCRAAGDLLQPTPRTSAVHSLSVFKFRSSQTPRRCSRPHRWREVRHRPFPAFRERLGQKQRGRAGHATAAAWDEA